VAIFQKQGGIDIMTQKVLKYLSKKERYEYNNLDKILSYYANGEFEKFLKFYEASDIKFYPNLKRKGSSLTVDFQYYNFRVGIYFDEVGYVIHQAVYTGTNIPKENVTKEDYNLGFNIVMLLENIIDQMKSDPELVEEVKPSNKPKTDEKPVENFKKVKLIFIIPFVIFYILISLIVFVEEEGFRQFFFVPIIFFVVIALVIFILAIKKIKK
jgi:hypothetical protein